MLIAALEFVTQVKGNCAKNSVRTSLPRNQSGQWYINGSALTATSYRWTRQLAVNPLYCT
jgi:hypothetical protein